MLERLFNLEQYGEVLSIKLSREINKEKVKHTTLLGKLSEYEGINNEKRDELEKELKISKECLETANKSLREIEKNFKVNEELWNLQLELKEYKDREAELIKTADKIESDKKKIKLAEGALKIKPYILNYENTTKDIDETQSKLKVLLSNIEALEKSKKESEELWNIAREKKDKDLPEYRIKEEKVREALSEKKSLDNLCFEIKEIENNLDKLISKEENYEDELVKSQNSLKICTESINEQEEIKNTLKIDSVLRNKVQEGLILTNKYIEVLEYVEKNKAKIEQINKEIEILNKEEIVLKESIDKNNKVLLEDENSLEILIKKCPGNQKQLLELQKLYSESKKNLQDFNKANDEIAISKENILKFNKTLIELRDKKSNLEKIIDELKSTAKEIERENIAHTLRNDLSYGDICPVCGSIEHHIENLKHIEVKDIVPLESSIKEKQDKLKKIDTEIIEMEMKEELFNNKIEENKKIIESLGKDFNENSVKSIENEFTLLEKALEEYELKKEALEKKIKSLREESNNLNIKYTNLENKIQNFKEQLKEVNDEFLKKSEELKINLDKLNKLKNETKVSDFIEKNNEINKIEKQNEEVEKKLKKYREELDKLSKIKDDAVKNLNDINQELTKVNVTLNEKNKAKDEKYIIIKSKVQDIDNIENELVNIKEVIQNIEESYKNTETLKREKEESYESCNLDIIKLNSKKADLYKRKDEEFTVLNKILKEENFVDINSVKLNILDKKEIVNLQQIVDEYKNKMAKVTGTIESISKKIDNRILTEEIWLNIQNEKELKKAEIERLNKTNISLEEQFKHINNKLFELKDLFKERDELEHKLALLNDLDKLFKGKKFVEFVATTRLKYVSREASNILKQITNSNYGLEVNKDGKFIVRDYKNGGISRDAATLSGGETFLASLALALALSTEIQLKGTAPLELFFLDEGFGTLDDDLLETVISSLERIHHDKLRIGIISHVEAIKNRMPVKLIVTPAESGMGGSKVRIENN